MDTKFNVNKLTNRKNKVENLNLIDCGQLCETSNYCESYSHCKQENVEQHECIVTSLIDNDQLVSNNSCNIYSSEC